MKHNVINLIDVNVKSNHPYTLYFKYVKSKDYSDQEHNLTYDGANVRADDLYLDETSEEVIKEQLNNLYGYGPYKANKVKEIFEKSDKQITW